MGLPKKNIEKKNIFRENHVEVRRFDGTLSSLFLPFSFTVLYLVLVSFTTVYFSFREDKH
jgi:hypothetical protein